MSETKSQGYEYLSIDVKKGNVKLYQELYETFGWEMFEINKKSENYESIVKINIKFRRKIVEQNPELINLQENAFNLVNKIEIYNKNKRAFVSSWTTLCAILSVILIVLSVPLMLWGYMIWFGILLSLGSILFLLTILVFFKTKNFQHKKYNPKIIEANSKLEEIYKKAKNIIGS